MGTKHVDSSKAAKIKPKCGKLFCAGAERTDSKAADGDKFIGNGFPL